MYSVEGVSKVYEAGGASVPVLNDVRLTVDSGQFVGLIGPSGSGKSTLLHCLGLLDRSYTGRYAFKGIDAQSLSDAEASRLRNREVGFVFQAFHLFPQLTVAENIMVPLEYAGLPRGACRARAAELAERVGLGHRVRHTPAELSGGEQQRVAIARALANRPSLILADEPTGNLDHRTTKDIMNLLHEVHAQGCTLVIVTHNPELLNGLDAVFVMDGGRAHRREAPVAVYRRQRARAGEGDSR